MPALGLHEPAIRNDLLMLFSGLEAAALASREGKEGMRKQALATVLRRADRVARAGLVAMARAESTRDRG